MRLTHWHSPVKPTSPATVILCAESNIRLLASTILSNFDTSASFALRCAARNRATFCSGVSTSGIDPALLLPPEPPGALPGVGDEGTAAVFGEAKRGGGAAALELAWGMVAVNRVASETLRGAADNRTVGLIVSFRSCISSGTAGCCPDMTGR
jgi:hypothetical protein